MARPAAPGAPRLLPAALLLCLCLALAVAQPPATASSSSANGEPGRRPITGWRPSNRALYPPGGLPDNQDYAGESGRGGLHAHLVDEGERVEASVREWQQQQTFCFLENATLRVRLDALNRCARPLVDAVPAGAMD
jgi:hypothetical protein